MCRAMRKAVIVEPEIPENTGFIARLAANFEFQLRVVNPEFNLSEARKTASSGQHKLRDARIFESVEEAIDDLDYVVATKPGRGKSLSSFDPRANTSVMIGRESSGLTSEELGMCDAVVHLETPGYSSLNQSHAAAILFHALSVSGDREGLDESRKEKIREITSRTAAETIIESNPSRETADRIIRELGERELKE